jgi:hypothetical protein
MFAVGAQLFREIVGEIAQAMQDGHIVIREELLKELRWVWKDGSDQRKWSFRLYDVKLAINQGINHQMVMDFIEGRVDALETHKLMLRLDRLSAFA